MIRNVYQLLLADLDVIAFVADRVYMPPAPQGVEAPYILWQPISNVAYNSLTLGATDAQQRHQLDIYADSPVVARQTTEAVRDCLQQHGNIISGPVPAVWDDSTTLHRWTLDVSLFYDREAA